MRNKIFASFVLSFALLIVSAKAQQPDTLKTYHFDGTVEVTNNGFSFVPTFNLGKPATIISLNTGGKRFTFEPQFRFDLDGMRPWSFIGFWRYKIVATEKVMLRVGTQFPAIAFSYEDGFTQDSTTYQKILAQRFLPFDVTLNYNLSKKVSIGTFTLYGHGLEDAEQLEHSVFVSTYASIHDVLLGEKLVFNWSPQLYYLNIDGTDGYYSFQNFSLGHKDFPISIASMFNIELASDIGTEDFTWNISLVYSFKNTLTKK